MPTDLPMLQGEPVYGVPFGCGVEAEWPLLLKELTDYQEDQFIRRLVFPSGLASTHFVLHVLTGG